MSIKLAYMTATLVKGPVPISRFAQEAGRDRLVPALKRTGDAIEAPIARTGH